MDNVDLRTNIMNEGASMVEWTMKVFEYIKTIFL